MGGNFHLHELYIHQDGDLALYRRRVDGLLLIGSDRRSLRKDSEVEFQC